MWQLKRNGGSNEDITTLIASPSCIKCRIRLCTLFNKTIEYTNFYNSMSFFDLSILSSVIQKKKVS
jgi:hypothetical protein